jgi:predicted P-loop ATPase
MKLFMRGAIARVVDPGCQFDEMIVLVGGQGIGKSTFLRKLAHQPNWFDGNFNTIEGDTAVERLRGKWLLEMAELLSLKKAKEVEAVKSFITNRIDTIRPKYAKETEDRPRTCVFAGTTNDMDFLSDPTGNRRFLPIHCGAGERQEFLFSDEAQGFIDQCWAEMYAAWKAGDRRLELPVDILAMADKIREDHTEDDPRVALIQQYLDAKMQKAEDPESVSSRVCVTEILKDVLEVSDYRNPPRRLVNEIHAIMRNSIEGYMPYGKSGGKALTVFGVQRCYVIDVESSRYALYRHSL